MSSRILHSLALTTTALATLTMSTGCSFSFDLGGKPTTAPSASAPTTTQVGAPAPSSDEPSAESSPSESETAPSTPQAPASTAIATPDTGAGESAGTQPEASQGGGDAGDSADSTGETIPVPSGTALKSMSLLHIYGGQKQSSGFGQAVGIFKINTTQPLFITTKIQLFDDKGTKVGEKTAINIALRTGEQHLITQNLIEVMDGSNPTKFKVSIVEVKPYTNAPKVTKFTGPSVGKNNLAQTLTGSYAYTNAGKSSTIEVNGACVLPDKSIVYGSHSVADKASGNYEIPMYDAPEGADLSSATCYVSM